jgi:hypothetical protein
VVVDTLPNGALHVRNAAEGAWSLAKVDRWRVEEELRIGQFEGDPQFMFGQIRNVIPNADGSIWALESQVRELRLFDASGQFVRAVGRAGGGPGEFSVTPCAFRGPNSEVWTEDARRWQRFHAAGTLIGQIPSTSNIGCGIRQWTPDGLLVVNVAQPGLPTGPGEAYFVVHRLDAGGALVAGDTVQSPVLPRASSITWVSADGRYRIMSILPFAHRASWTITSAGDFWVTPGGGEYLIQRQSLAGDTLLVIERAYEPIAVPDSTRERAIREFQPEGMTAVDGFDPGQVPRVYPPFEQIQVATDGTLWVRRQLEDGVIGLDVFSAEGRYLGAADVPEDFRRMSIQHITEDHMYGIVRDELDVQYVVRLGIRREAR